MTRPLLRVMHPLVRGLVLGAAIGWSPAPAQAGENYTVPVCADSSDVIAFFAKSTFAGVSNCESLCKKLHGKCKEFLAKSKACENAFVATFNFFEKETDCDPNPDPVARKICRDTANADAQARKESIKNEDDLAKDTCLEIRENCVASCTAPM